MGEKKRMCVGATGQMTSKSAGSNSATTVGELTRRVQALAASVEGVAQTLRANREPRVGESVEESRVAAFLTPEGELVGFLRDPHGPRQYLPPKPYWLTNTALSAEEVSALESERDELIDSMRHLPWAERVRAESRVKEIERQLHSDRLRRGVAKRKQEREVEREHERPGRYDG